MKRVLLLALSAWMAVATVEGKTPPQKPAQTSTLLRVTTHLVQVNVIALDRQGHPVTGLTQNDFKVYDNGKQQNIIVFRVESSQRRPASLPKLPPNTFTNLFERAGYAPTSVTVILLDALNTPFAAQVFAHQQMIKFLEGLRPNDSVALYALDKKLMVLHDFTNETATLLEAVRRYKATEVSDLHASESDSPARLRQGEFGTGLSSRASGAVSNHEAWAEAGLLTQFMSEAQSREQDFYTRERVRITTNALIAIANHLSGLPGRKNLIWVSGGFPVWNTLDHKLGLNGFRNAQDLQSDISRAARAVNNVNLAIYPIDPRGLGQATYDRPVPQTMEQVVDSRENEGNSIGVMEDLAKRTGGRAFYNTNDILGSVRRVVDDSSITYVLAYEPRGVKWNGQFRKISVKVAQRGVRLQYRNGYSALPAKKLSDSGSSAAIATTLASPLDAAGMGLTVRFFDGVSGGSAGQQPRWLEVLVDPRDMTFKQQGKRWDADLTLVAREIGATGESLKAVSQTIQLRLKPKTYQRVLDNGFTFKEPLPFPILNRAERLRILIRDDPTGAIGSVNIPLDRLTRTQGQANH
jgi:VWFA-related protein